MDKLAFGSALLLYIAAKITEINDHALLESLGIISGHTLKHLLATAAAAVIVARLIQRVRHEHRQFHVENVIHPVFQSLSK